MHLQTMRFVLLPAARRTLPAVERQALLR